VDVAGDLLARQGTELLPCPTARLVQFADDREVPQLERRVRLGPAERTGKSRVTYWPGETRAGSTSAARRPRNPRETYVVRSRSTSLGGTPVFLFVLVCEVGVCVGVVVDVECHVALRTDLEVGAVALVPDTDD
jgi:hypothetical protein